MKIVLLRVRPWGRISEWKSPIDENQMNGAGNGNPGPYSRLLDDPLPAPTGRAISRPTGDVMSLSTTCTSPKYRLLLNGLLLGVGWTAALTGYARIGATLLIAGSAITGLGMSVRAYNARRTRYVCIELLITIATPGPLLLADYIESY